MNENINLIHGDCLEKMKDIPDKSIDMILCDPPYGINFKSGRRKTKFEKIKNDNDLFFLDELFKESYRILKDNTAIYVFCSWHNVDVFKKHFEKYFKLKNIIIWEKNNASMGDLKAAYAPKHEFILYGNKGRRFLEGFRYRDIVRFKKTGNKLHPTQKPVDLLEFLIKNSSKYGDVILDQFMGAGSTGIACLNTNRKFIGIELDDNYFEVAKKRIEEHTPKISEVN